MIKVVLNEKDGEISLTVKGHAGMADVGKDIVCASASILAYTVGQTVKWMSESNLLTEAPIVSIENGNAQIVCKPKEDQFSFAYACFSFAQTGYTLLAHNYKEFVRIKQFGKG